MSSVAVDPKLVEHERVALIFEGLDTAAEVAVNSKTVGESDNMFVRYVFDVKDYLEVCENGSKGAGGK